MTGMMAPFRVGPVQAPLLSPRVVEGNNSENGSLQISAPNTSYSLEETDVISFDFTLLTYSTAVDAFCDAEPGYYRAEDAGFFTGQWVRPDGTMGNDFMGFDEWMCQRE